MEVIFVKRIQENEERLNTLKDILEEYKISFDQLKNSLSDFYELNDYYGSTSWLQDKEDFENGKYPNLKAGVLSEDAVWNLDEEFYELITEMKKMTQQVKNHKQKKSSFKQNDLLMNIDKIHTTELGRKRIQKNLNLSCEDVVSYLKDLILDSKTIIYKDGKNWYCKNESIRITINSYNYLFKKNNIFLFYLC